MSEVLVVVEHGEGAVTKPTLELLTLARRMGDPVAVLFGDLDLTEILGTYGASAVLVVDDPAIEQYLVAPKAEALDQLAVDRQPAAILISSTPEGKEIAGRLAVRLELGPDHRRDRRGCGRIDCPVGVRGQLHGQGRPDASSLRAARDHRQAELRRAGAGIRVGLSSSG